MIGGWRFYLNLMTDFILPKKKKICYTAPHILQTPEWGELKSAFGWDAVHVQVGTLAL